MKKRFYTDFLKFIFILPLGLGHQLLFAQLDTIHWIPPLHSHDNAQVADHYIYLSTPLTTTFVVTIKDGAGNILAAPTISNASPVSWQIGTGQIPGTQAFLPIDSLNTVLKKSGLILSAPDVFYANLRVRSTSQADCLTAKGRAALGTTFRVGGFPQVVGSLFGTNRNFTAGIMATANNTTVTISGYNTGVVFADPSAPFSSPSLTFTLNQGECYVVSGYDNPAANLSGFIGALIQSNNPIVLNNGNMLGTIANNTGNQDIGIDQSVPITKIGQDYILIEGEGDPAMERPIVIAHYNNTGIFVNGSATPLATINAGQFYMVPNANYQGTPHRNMYIHTSQPAYMYQALAGSISQATGGLNFIPPFSCYLKDTIDLIPSVNSIGAATYTGGVMIFTEQGATLKINGVTQTAAVPVTGAPWETYKVLGLTGNVAITSTKGVAAGIFGSGGAVGYAGYYSGFSEIPTVDAGQDTLICSGQNIPLNVTTSISGGTYSWSPPAGLSNPNISNPVANPATTTTYTVTITDTKGCTITDSLTITVVSTLTVSVSTQSVTCFGGNNGSASVSVSGGSGIYTYLWNTSPVQTTQTASNLPAGNYTVIISDTSVVCGTNTQIISITEPAALTSSISVTNVSCNGGNDGNVTVTAAGGSGSYTYLWSTIPVQSTQTAANLPAGNYTVIISDASGCTAAATAMVSQPQPLAVSISGNTTLCQGSSTTLSASGGASYSWNTTATTSSITFTPTSTSTYSVIATDANGCTAMTSTVVIVNPLPSAAITGNTIICVGDAATLTASGGINYVWSTTAATPLIVVSPSSNSSYFVLVTDANGCSNIASATVTVNPLPVASITGSAMLCAGDTAILTASGGTNYLWNTTATTSSISSTLTSTSTFSVIVTDANGCSNIASATVTVNPLPNISISGNTTVCQGDIITLAASGGINYSWNNGNTSSSIFTTTSSTYSVTGTDASGCSASATVAATVLPPPVASISGDTILCQGDAAVLTASGGGNYLWSTNETTSSITVSSAGNYSVMVSVGSCINTASVTVTVNLLPNASAGNDTTISLGGNTILNGSGNGISFNWSPSSGLNCTNCQSPTASPTETTAYTLTVTDANGCTATAFVTITVEPPVCGALFLPNAFSPNGDGENDFLQIYFNFYCIEKLHIRIFNRWGEKVFESTDPQFQWNGTDDYGMIKDREMNSSVFIYFLDVKTTEGKNINGKGNVSLIR